MIFEKKKKKLRNDESDEQSNKIKKENKFFEFAFTKRLGWAGKHASNEKERFQRHLRRRQTNEHDIRNIEGSITKKGRGRGKIGRDVGEGS